MPRKSSGGTAPKPAKLSRPAPKSSGTWRPPPAKTSHAPPPAPQQPSCGGSLLGSLGATIAEGMAFGTGSAVARRAVDAVMGPQVVQHEHASTPMASQVSSTMSDSCTAQAKAFQDCITSNGSEIGKCQFYLNMLNECKRGSTRIFSLALWMSGRYYEANICLLDQSSMRITTGSSRTEKKTNREWRGGLLKSAIVIATTVLCRGTMLKHPS